MSIIITEKDPNTFQVRVQNATETTHRVTLTDTYHQKLTDGNVSKEKLIERSFAFLLERESNTQILKSFDLPLIQSYFPEYENLIQST